MDFIWNKIQFAITDLDGGKLGEKIPMHVHAKGCYELHFVTEGKGTLIADGREIELKKTIFSLISWHKNSLLMYILHQEGSFFYCPFFTDLFIIKRSIYVVRFCYCLNHSP